MSSRLVARMPLIESVLDANPRFITDLAAAADKVHSPARALKLLGLEHHPSAALITGYRDPMHSKIVYHADPGTLYRVACDWAHLAPPCPPAQPMLQNQMPGPAMSVSAQAALLDGDAPSSGQVSSEAGSASSSSNSQRGHDVLALLEPESSVPAFGGAMDDVFKTYLLRSLANLLEHDRDSSQDPSNPLKGKVVSARFSPADAEAFRVLCEDLPGPASDAERARIGEEVRAASRHGWTFFQLLRTGVGDIVTPLKMKHLFKRTDWAIMLLQVFSIDKVAKTFTVGPLERVANVVLSLDALPLASLLQLGVWSIVPELQYSLPGVAFPSIEQSHVAHAPALLSDLLVDGGFTLQGGDEAFHAKSNLLNAMLEQGLVRRGGDGGWWLSDSGKAAVQVGQAVSNVQKLVKLPARSHACSGPGESWPAFFSGFGECP